ncbi:MAG TPA: hypothetical protein VLM85_27520 [Polyangiaceae bacterium]|nr:hypothetical protein [Polyangiaceae bacterium]
MTLACGPQTECAGMCTNPALSVVVPQAEVGQVLDVVASDVACAGASVTCASTADGGCPQYTIVPIAKGNCHVDVFLASGTTFSADVKIVQTTGCCAGLYADPASAATIEVP